jgi:hypothetical protein
MATPTVIKDNDSGRTAIVTKFNQLVVAPLDYSVPVSDSLDVIDTAFNFVAPEQDQSIVITDIIASADNAVSNVVPAEVEIYEATSATTTTIDRGIVSPRIVRGSNFTLVGLNMLVPEGKWVNAKTNDNNVLVTIMFYRVPAENV